MEEFFLELTDKADSIYFSRYKDSIFNYDVLDTRPSIKSESNNEHELIIKKLNEKLNPADSIEFTSNIAIFPYYIIELIIDKTGKIINANVKESKSVGGLEWTERLMIKELKESQNWEPGKIRNQPVNSRIEITIAIRKK